MSLRSLEVLGGSLSTLMLAPSSAEPDTHERCLGAFYGSGGNCLHLHGEGGETHSRMQAGDWLRKHSRRPEFFLCTQICHDDWDDAAKRPTDRFTPAAVHQDVATDIELLGTDYLDMVYLDDRPSSQFEPVLDAVVREIKRGKVRAVGVRNWSEDRIRAAHAYLMNAVGGGIAAVITTELSLLVSTRPLWPEYLPFGGLREAVSDLGLTVLAHMGDMCIGECLFGDEDALARMRPEWVSRWKAPGNIELVRCVNEIAASYGRTPREIQISWLLNQPFPVIGIVGGTSLLSGIGAEYEGAAQLALTEADLSRLSSLRAEQDAEHI